MLSKLSEFVRVLWIFDLVGRGEQVLVCKVAGV
jgi:hypothetical protein